MKKKFGIIMMTAMLAMASLTGCNSTKEVSSSDVATDAPSKAEAVDGQEVEKVKVIETADDAIAVLKEGNERFVNDKSEVRNADSATRAELTKGQEPYAVVISCADSRVSPSVVFNAGLGEIFEIRVAGNVLDDLAMASVEYGAEHLGCPVVVVMGHESCGAVTAAHDAIEAGSETEGKLADLVEEIRPSIDLNKTIDECAHDNVQRTIDKIKEDEVMANLINNGTVRVVGAYYSLDGKVTFEE